MIRTGIGYDVHQLAEGETFIIGGVQIASTFGSVGHSDGDALFHAVVDALLGAAGLGDIGQFFPSEDDTWKGAPSSHFLADAVKRVREAGFEINNVDAIIILQKPKLSELISQMKNNLAYSMQVDESQVSVKATTTDSLGFVGDGSGWAVQAIATICKNNNDCCS
ncbi:MAG: 2-C-methyl-D-erythritol 2,4-cyclodiphosphate synthase [Candidatus Marinimicrobia bacterium]|jgi:2-C-methyl-D-erythritol 2,4-cyclodiphosphate synthase|nr:2-C-methyl-D-erythritol 2,4-cyclodiphosphate synthase [Candidatus Neomarinimicrobiota bacterium]MBT6796901.1 2-C-methyl-D-erythritol 2,4-cyclodiphosphate synthase [Candidatus Neomarinimicrobiota bacterium]MBT6866751.1 2-C-methyl-D-erythritol 2,4-cyclodiphosphate synthase [Candidatus Neomarinimicrobiota bacterium]MBT7042805.1 2-C-methyl-D-erythritol 2,4-cyclodiphosphate synthase [Candidatus Neomarinimicrobiota bacterium]MBT7515308.1 2-C-methyl-D-erythritol 2,4-cyclodiphosphate synthase [Candi|tara:strand:- start:622 stop:1116 length:495 start_codon:yes stop_codon:yes gene_type:complete